MLSREGTQMEATWSLGEYTTGQQIWKAFALPDEPPDPVGVFAHQPSPYAGKTGGYLRTFALLALSLLLLLAGRELTAAREQVFAHDYAFQPAATAEATCAAVRLPSNGVPRWPLVPNLTRCRGSARSGTRSRNIRRSRSTSMSASGGAG